METSVKPAQKISMSHVTLLKLTKPNNAANDARLLATDMTDKESQQWLKSILA
jgi:hypothetical protein